MPSTAGARTRREGAEHDDDPAELQALDTAARGLLGTALKQPSLRMRRL